MNENDKMIIIMQSYFVSYSKDVQDDVLCIWQNKVHMLD